jgi:hypothetical protein
MTGLSLGCDRKSALSSSRVTSDIEDGLLTRVMTDCFIQIRIR